MQQCGLSCAWHMLLLDAPVHVQINQSINQSINQCINHHQHQSASSSFNQSINHHHYAGVLGYVKAQKRNP